ncbi:hypothetical protein, variant [Verruconis gallopava]|nr:hypothetical protein, variant [Verruconis gallopava]KIW05173.1 hypothetical protein, variant [Verruconis gallopava]
MSIPDPSSSYDDFEGVHPAIIRAYDAWAESVDSFDGSDIYGIGVGSSREVSPERTSLATSPSQRKLSISCIAPARLTSHIPPTNFGAVMPGEIFRSQFPLPENFSFLKTLKLKTILTLVPEPYPQPYVQFLDDAGIKQIRVHVPANKEVIKIEPATMAQALGAVLDRSNYPLLIHCNKGKHRTGCVVACFRKVLGADLDSILHEYHTYAGRKARVLDQDFIRSFDERALLWLARENGYLSDDEPRSESPSVMNMQLPSRTRG